MTCSVDHLERLERSREAIGYDAGEEYTQMEFDWSVAGKGELLWDLAGGHAHALRCEAQLGVDVRLGITQPLFDQEVEVQASYALSGESVVTMSLDE